MALTEVEEIGDLGLTPVETWFYTAATVEACPGLPSWEALKTCADKLAAAETFPDGRLLDYPADWGTSNVDRLKALGLPFKSLPAGSEGALVSEIKGAEAKKAPLLVMFWSPHWVHARHVRSVLGVASSTWNSPGVHTVVTLQTRLELSVGVFDSNSSAVHTVSDWHVRSVVSSPKLVSNSSPEHCVRAVQTRLDVAVGTPVSNCSSEHIVNGSH